MQPVPLTFTVIICAYTLDRWSDLTAAVESVQHQSAPPSQFILVIDHNDELLARAREAFPDVTVIPNAEQQGLSGARNTGLAAATSEIVAFLDDDAVASETWLAELAEGFSAAENVLGVGGRIEPLWEATPPGWFPGEFYWVLGCTYTGMAEGTAVRNLIGANMSFRREILAEVGGFSHELGRTKTQALGLGDEETGACIRARQLHPDGVFLHTEHALVRHRVPASRATWRYYRQRCWGEGLSKAQLSRAVGSRDGLSSERTHAFVTLPRGAARALGTWFRGDSAGLARAAAIIAGLAVTGGGYVLGRVVGRAPGHAESAEVAPGANGSAASPAPSQPTAATQHTQPDPRTAAGDSAAAPIPARRLKLLMVTPRYFPLVGGVEHHVAQVARLLARGADVTVLTTDATGELPEREVVDGVEILRVKAGPKDRDYYVAPGIWREIVRRRQKYDLVHVQSYHTAVAPLAMLAALRAGLPYVLTFHGGGHSSHIREALRGMQWLLLRPLFRRADRLIAVADFEAERFSTYLDLPRELFVVVPNGSDLPALEADEIARLRKEGGNEIVSVGRLERYKGHHRVIEALPAVLAEIPDATLRVIGTGPYEPELRTLVESLGLAERVSVGAIPPTDRKAMAEAFARAALVVLMSEFETHPLAVIEAIALGRPALVANTSGLAELAENGYARAVPLEISTADLAQAMVAELREPHEVPSISAPTWQECAESLAAIYADVLESRQPATLAAVDELQAQE